MRGKINGFTSRQRREANLVLKFNNTGFTLTELLVVVLIISLLTSISAAIFGNLQKNSRDTKRQADLKIIQSALEQYHADQGFYPKWESTLDTKITNASGRPSPTPAITTTYLQLLPVDPINNVKNGISYFYRYYAFPETCNNSVGNYCIYYCLYNSLENTDGLPPRPPSCQYYSGVDLYVPPNGYNYAVMSP